jgi:peptidoglycan/xylan/chitin deacetylase (PgdA/CDA1 family)
MRRSITALFPALPRQISRAAYGVLRRSGAAHWNRRTGAMIFCYHNVVPDDVAGRVGEGWLHVGVSEFKRQIEWIADAYTVIPLPELVGRLKQGRSLGGLAALTFDDGYRGLLKYGVPFLRSAQLPFAIFPIAATASEPRLFWWDHLGPLQAGERQHLISALQGDAEQIDVESQESMQVTDDVLPASWTELRGALGPDCEIGVHTVTHRNLAPLASDEIAWELTHARDRLAEELNVDTRVVAYPYGGTSGTVFAEMKKAGFEAGLGLQFGMVRSGADPFDLARVNVPAGMRMSGFACWGSGLKLRF